MAGNRGPPVVGVIQIRASRGHPSGRNNIEISFYIGLSLGVIKNIPPPSASYIHIDHLVLGPTDPPTRRQKVHVNRSYSVRPSSLLDDDDVLKANEVYRIYAPIYGGFVFVRVGVFLTSFLHLKALSEILHGCLALTRRKVRRTAIIMG